MLFCSQLTAAHGLNYFWVDTCCVNDIYSAELFESINSMFRWHEHAQRCYVCISDMTFGEQKEDGNCTGVWETAFTKSPWFTRGWT